MTRSPHVCHLRQGTKMGNATMIDSMIHDGLTDAIFSIHMGETAENLATKYEISRAVSLLNVLRKPDFIYLRRSLRMKQLLNRRKEQKLRKNPDFSTRKLFQFR